MGEIVREGAHGFKCRAHEGGVAAGRYRDKLSRSTQVTMAQGS